MIANAFLLSTFPKEAWYGRPSGNVRGAEPYVIAPPTLCAHIPPAKDKGVRGRDSLDRIQNSFYFAHKLVDQII